jgi:RNA polymerase sigma factor (sigma-70 family)
LAEVVRCAARGDQTAWDALVDRFGRTMFAVARSTGLDHASASDVCQTSWLRLTQHLDTITDPSRVGAWLTTTTRREAIRVSKRAQRLALRDELDPAVLPATVDRLDPSLLNADRDRALWQVQAALPERARTLLSLLMMDPPLSYKELSRLTGMPIGSIGPTRARILAGMRGALEDCGITAADVGIAD